MAKMTKGMDADAESLELLRRLNSLGLIAFDRKADNVSINPVVLSIFRDQGLAGQATTIGSERHLSSGEDRRTNENVAQAKAMLGGQTIAFDEMVKLAKWLKNARYFSYARQIFARARTLLEAKTNRLWLGQQHALCTYKDPDLPTVEKLDRALEILQEVDDLPTTRNQETLGLTGSIFRQKWEADGQRLNLERSLAYYSRGYQQGIESDYAYTAINTAFVLDLLALQEEKEYRVTGAPAARATASSQPTNDLAESVPFLRRRVQGKFARRLCTLFPAWRVVRAAISGANTGFS